MLDLSFLKSQEQKRFGTQALVSFSENNYYLNNYVLKSLVSNKEFSSLFIDVVVSGLEKNKKYPEILTIGTKIFSQGCH
ncbi:DUF3427 domain-containing protein [Streptococcus iniae]|uniref:DUF3427 domain-containing protein n=1 Tax=Streptococcus iniae TaxID=1346 RepID=UPI00223934EB|nr:DUF3427 domain-containing protein [Streptococcus iniae]